MPVRWSYVLLVGCLWCVPAASQAQAVGLLDMADSLIMHVRWRQADAVLHQIDETDLSPADRARFKLYRSYVLGQNEEFDKSTSTGLEAMTMAQRLHLPEIEVGARLQLALIQELVGEPRKSAVHLDKVLQLINDHELNELYPHYCVRRSSLIRVSTKDPDSLKQATRLAQLATEQAGKYRQPWHLADAHLLLSLLDRKTDLKSYMHHQSAAIRIYMGADDFYGAGMMLLGLAQAYAGSDSMRLAFVLYDSAVSVLSRSRPIPDFFYAAKADMFSRMGMHDSARVYADKRFMAYRDEMAKQTRVEIAKLNAMHENEQKEKEIEQHMHENRVQRRQLLVAVMVAAVVLFALLGTLYAYRRLKANNREMAAQAKALHESLHRQKVLLAEVQHRVKNNLQVIIGLLELQKDAQQGKTIADITNESQKRIESMAFLHDRVYLSDDLDKVDLRLYLDEITELIRKSYSVPGQQVEIEVMSDLKTISIDKAIPLGLITVELLINSFKHAFEETAHSRITIRTLSAQTTGLASQFIYHDNGKGFDANSDGAGLGMEIIKGLVGQLHGRVSFDGNNGFEASILF